MFNAPILQRLGKWLSIAAMLGFGFAFAQSEPTLNQVYEAAQTGKLDQAQLMMQQVLISHPNSAKAHFVQAELFARQGKISRANEALATAEKLAPGLPFAKPEAIQGLRAQIAAHHNQPAPGNSPKTVAGMTSPASSAPSFSWGLPLLLAGGVIALGYFIFRRKPPTGLISQSPYATPAPLGGGLSGPQTFGTGGTMAPAYGQPVDSGLGGKVMGGLATGLAVGAGVMAAQAIGKSLMGGHEPSARVSDSMSNNNFEPIADNYDMGGQNFGVNDAGSWDDGSGVSDGGGWDN